LGPGETDFTYEYFTHFDVNNRDDVVFSASLWRNAAPPGNRTSGIYLGTASGVTTLLHQGDPAPDGNGTFGDLAVPLQVTNGGGVVFAASLENTADPGWDEQGIFYIDSKMEVHTIVRAGQPLAGSTVISPWILVSDFLGGFAGLNLGIAGVNCINEAGQVAFVAALMDGRQGIFLWGSEDLFADGFESGDAAAWAP
jgi:hypothetical protein